MLYLPHYRVNPVWSAKQATLGPLDHPWWPWGSLCITLVVRGALQRMAPVQLQFTMRHKLPAALCLLLVFEPNSFTSLATSSETDNVLKVMRPYSEILAERAHRRKRASQDTVVKTIEKSSYINSPSGNHC